MTLFSTGLASRAHRHAFRDVGEFVTFFLARFANIRGNLGEGRRERRIGDGECIEGAAGGDRLLGRLGAARHAAVAHVQHAETMSKAIIAGIDAFGAGFGRTLVQRRMVMRLPASLFSLPANAADVVATVRRRR